MSVSPPLNVWQSIYDSIIHNLVLYVHVLCKEKKRADVTAIWLKHGRQLYILMSMVKGLVVVFVTFREIFRLVVKKKPLQNKDNIFITIIFVIPNFSVK